MTTQFCAVLTLLPHGGTWMNLANVRSPSQRLVALDHECALDEQFQAFTGMRRRDATVAHSQPLNRRQA